MTDAEWKRLIERAGKARRNAEELRKQAEAEYVRRFGENPSDLDDDWWIDTMESFGDAVNITQIIANAEEAMRLKSVIGVQSAAQ